MAFDVEAAKKAGYTQEEIDDYLRSKQTQEAPGAEPGEPPPPPPPDSFKQAGEGNMMPAIGTVAAAAAPYAIPAVATGAGLYGAAKVGGWGRDMLNTAREGMEAYKHGVNTANEIAQRNAALQEARMAERMARGGQAVQQASQAGQQAFNQMGQQLARPGPVAPSVPTPAPTAAPTPQQPSMMQKGMEYANKMRQIAAEKVMQNAGTLGRAGVGAAALLTPGNAGQQYNFPTTGKYAGMEINPMTGRPWTKQELAQYR